MPRKSSIQCPEVINLVDSDDDGSIEVIKSSSSNQLQNSRINLSVGAMVSTPYGTGQIIEKKEVVKDNRPRKRPRNTSNPMEAEIENEEFVFVQLSYGRATLRKAIVSTIDSPYLSDMMRCQSRMMFNDNLVNFAISQMMKTSANISILNSHALSMFRSRLNEASLSDSEKKIKLQKLLPGPISQLKYLFMPVYSDMHWSMVVLCNLDKIIDRMNLIYKLKTDAIADVDLINCTPTVKRAKVKQCIDNYDLQTKVDLEWKTDGIPCFMHFDSANIHRMQQAYGVLRRVLNIVLDFEFNSLPKEMIDVAEDENVDGERVDKALGSMIDAFTLPGVSVSVPQQVRYQYDEKREF